MNITKADYDELVRLRGLGYEWIENNINGHKMAKKYGRGLGIKPNFFKRVIPRQGVINIAAAIAEYERAQEVNHE